MSKANIMKFLIARLRGKETQVLVDSDDYHKLKNKTICIDGRGYAFISPEKTKVHRFIMDVHNPNIQVDHINGNKLDNRKENLRLVSNKENARNLHNHKVKSKHGYFGVAIDKRENLAKRWIAYIKKDYKLIFLGRFETSKEAAQAYNKAAESFGYLTRNVINEV